LFFPLKNEKNIYFFSQNDNADIALWYHTSALGCNFQEMLQFLPNAVSEQRQLHFALLAKVRV